MRFVTFQSATGTPEVGLLDGDHVTPLRSLAADAPSDMIGVISRGEALSSVLAGRSDGAGERLALAEVSLCPPILRPGKILCFGLNYADHAAEGGNKVPDYPAVFMRTPASLVAPGGPVVRPKASEQLDYEAELTIVIGHGGRHISEADALDHVFGYTIMNDVSVRDFQRKAPQWTMGKNFDGTAPLGPAIVTGDELPAGADGLAIRTRLNGRTVQDSTTAEMVFKVAADHRDRLRGDDVGGWRHHRDRHALGRRPRAQAAALDEGRRHHRGRGRRDRHADEPRRR